MTVKLRMDTRTGAGVLGRIRQRKDHDNRAAGSQWRGPIRRLGKSRIVLHIVLHQEDSVYVRVCRCVIVAGEIPRPVFAMSFPGTT